MILYFSGETAAGRPEKVLCGYGNVMLTFNLIRRANGKPSARFKAMYKSRLKKRNKANGKD